MLDKRKDSFIEEAGNPREKVDSCPKKLILPNPQVLFKDYIGKRGKGYMLERELNLYFQR